MSGGRDVREKKKMSTLFSKTNTRKARIIINILTFTDPLLSVAVFQVIYIFVVPQHSDPQQVSGEEAIFSQDHKVCEEASCGLHHT